MNCLSIVLVIALVGYSLGAPQYGEYGLEEEHEQINPIPQNGSNLRNGNNREYGNSQGQGGGTKGGRIQGRGNNQRQGEYRQPEHGGYPAPEQQYGNNPGYGGRTQQYSQGYGSQQYSQGYGSQQYSHGYGSQKYSQVEQDTNIQIPKYSNNIKD